MRLCHKLDAADYAEASLPANVRILLERLVAEGGSPATTKGNLNRALIEGLFENLRMPATWRKMIRGVNKVLNETDVFDLHRARLVAEMAGLLALRKKRFAPTGRGLKLLAPDQAGEFYRAIFLGYFLKFNLAYESRFLEVPAIQDSMAAILWRIDAELRDWTPVAGLAARLLLPVPLRLVREAATPYIGEDQYLISCVHEPLRRMGLLESDAPEESLFGIEVKGRIRTTRLWRKFLWFDWQP